MSDTTPQPATAAERRARIVCAVSFGVAATLACGLVVGVGWLSAPDRAFDVSILLAPFLWAAPSALVGAMASRRLATMPTAGGGGFVGAGVTFGAAVLMLLVLYLVQAVASPSRSGAILAELLVPAVWWITLGVATLLSPVGALAGWLAWRRIWRGDAEKL